MIVYVDTKGIGLSFITTDDVAMKETGTEDEVN